MQLKNSGPECRAVLNLRGLLLVVLIGLPTSQIGASEPYPELLEYIQKRTTEFQDIPATRKAELGKLSQYIQERLYSSDPIQMTFICTHNSRRSHMAQLWSAVAARHYGIQSYKSYSGGTEATAFNPRAVAVLQRAGLKITVGTIEKNPHHIVSCGPDSEEWDCFSKVYSDPSNPSAHFCAVLTCLSADESCPIVAGADARFAIPYEDPKVADNTPEETIRYDERSAQIAREMLYVFSRIKR